MIAGGNILCWKNLYRNPAVEVGIASLVNHTPIPPALSFRLYNPSYKK